MTLIAGIFTGSLLGMAVGVFILLLIAAVVLAVVCPNILSSRISWHQREHVHPDGVRIGGEG